MAKYPQPILVIKIQYQSKVKLMSNPTFWEAATPPATQSDMDNIANAASQNLGAKLQSCIGTEAHYIGVTCLYISGGNILQSESQSGAGPGTGGDSLLPDQNALVIGKFTAKYGRQYRGRYFIGCVPQKMVSADNPNEITTDEDALSPWITLSAALGSDQTFGPTLCHARHWDRKSASLVPITACRLRSKFASQRKRRRNQPDLISST